MKALKKTLKFVKKKKALFFMLMLLELVLIIGFFFLVKNYEESTREYNLMIKEILGEAGYDQKTAISSLTERADDIPDIKDKIENEIMRFFIYFVLLISVIYAVFMALLLGKLKSWYPVKVAGILAVGAVIIAFIFNLMFELKESINSNQIISEKSIVSGILFILVAYFIVFLMSVLIVASRKGNIVKVFKRYMEIMKVGFWKLLGMYVVLNVILLIILFAVFVLMVVFVYSLVSFFLSLLIGIFVLVPYMTLSKVFFVKMIKKYE